MPTAEDIYWNSIDFDACYESLPDRRTIGRNRTMKGIQNVDPWDLENYEYIRQHLLPHSESTSPPQPPPQPPGPSSQPSSMSSTGSDDFTAEANSTSFYYVPGGPKSFPHSNGAPIRNHSNGHYTGPMHTIDTKEIYAAIEDDKQYDSDFDEETTTSVEDNSLPYVPPANSRRRAPDTTYSSSGFTGVPDRSLSFSYGDYGTTFYNGKNDIYCRLDDVRKRRDVTLPSNYYSELNHPPHKQSLPVITNFGLTNYGHLKIDYSYSWSKLDDWMHL